MLSDAVRAFEQTLSPPFRAVLWKSLGLTVLLLALAGFGLDHVLTGLLVAPYPWVGTIIAVLTGLGLFVGLAFLIAPLSSIVAGFFLDELADHAERGNGILGRPVPVLDALWLGLKFAAVSLVVNIVALALLLVPGVNAIVFFVANAYLLGRAYFELAALRFAPIEEVRVLRRRHGTYLFFCGLLIAGLVAIPLVNLLTPLFGTAFMVRVHKRLALTTPAR